MSRTASSFLLEPQISLRSPFFQPPTFLGFSQTISSMFSLFALMPCLRFFDPYMHLILKCHSSVCFYCPESGRSFYSHPRCHLLLTYTCTSLVSPGFVSSGSPFPCWVTCLCLGSFHVFSHFEYFNDCRLLI